MGTRYYTVKDEVGYQIESTNYTEADLTTSRTHFGILNEEISFPNPNPYDPLPHIEGSRQPYTQASTERDYEFDISFLPNDGQAPYEIALGSRSTTSKDPDATADSGDEYTEILFEESDKLPTATVGRNHPDLDVTEKYVGCKADLNLSASVGEPLQVTMPTVAPIKNDDTSDVSFASVSVPTKEPFMFWMKGDVSVGSDTVATVESFDCTWDNGLQVNHHGNGRDGYSVSEETGAEKYDMSFSMTVENTDMWTRANSDSSKVDVTIPLHKDPSASSNTDSFIITLKNCKVTDAPVDSPAEGRLVSDVTLQPEDTTIEVREPA